MRRRRRRWPIVLAIVVALPLLALAAVVARLAYGPIEVSMATQGGRDLLATLVGPQGTSEVKMISLAWVPGECFVVRIDGVTVESPLVSADLPSIVIDVDVEPLLLSGKILAHSLLIDHPTIRLTAPENAGLDAPEPIAVLDLLDERLERLVDVAREHGIDVFEIRNGSTTVERAASTPLTLTQVNVRAGVGALGEASASVTAESGSGTWTADITRQVSGGGSVISLHVDGVELATAMGTDAISPEITLSATGEAQFAENGEATAATLSFTLGSGTLSIGGVDDVRLSRAELNLGWHPDTGEFTISPSPISIDGLDLLFAGTVSPPAPSEPLWRFAATIPRATLAPPDVPGGSSSMDKASITGSFDPDSLTFVFDDFNASGPGGAVSGSGSLFIGPGGPRLKLGAVLDAPTDYETFVRGWPRFVNAPARKWLVDNVGAGVLVGGSAKVDLGPLDFDTDPRTTEPGNAPADIRFSFERAILRLPEELPPLAGAKGAGTILGPVMTVDIESGRMEPGGSGTVSVDAAKVVVPDLAARPLAPQLSATASGPADSVAVIADSAPANALKPLGISPDTLSGTASGSISISGPMDVKIDPAILEWKVDAKLENVGSTAPIAGRTITGADVTVVADKQAVTISGTATIDGIAADVDMTQPLASGAPVSAGARFVLTEADRRAKGIDLGDMLTGPVSVAIEQLADGTQNVSVDLEKAAVRLPPIGWSKGAGVAADAKFNVRQDKNGSYHIDDFVLTSEGVSLAGSLDVSGTGQLTAAAFRKFNLRPGDNASATARRTAGGGYAITVNARKFDGRSILRRLKDGAGAGGGGDAGGKAAGIDVTAKIDNLVGFNGSSLSNVDLAFATSGEHVSRLRIAARTQPGGLPVSARLQPEGKQYRLTGSAGDTGRLMAFLDLYDRMIGGKGELTATMDPSTTAGTVVVSEFRVTEDPKLKQMENVARSNGSDRSGRAQPAAATAGASDWNFTRMNVRFSLAGKALTIEEVVLRGATSGGTASGSFDLGNGTMAITGTYIPVYAVNNLFGRIPVLGEILGAGRNGGLFGITFRLDGRIADPKLTFNPISSITPGILRRIFEFQ